MLSMGMIGHVSNSIRISSVLSLYRDKKISVKTYHDVLKTPMLLTLDVLSFHLHISK